VKRGSGKENVPGVTPR